MHKRMGAGAAAVFCAALSGLAAADEARPKLSLGPILTLDDLPTTAPIGAAAADTGAQQTPPPQSSYGITGNWFGLREKLANSHVYFGGYVYFDLSRNIRGGLDTDAWATSYLLDLHVVTDMEKTLGWTGGTAFLDFQSHDQSQNHDALVGDIQGFDNLVGPRFAQIAQLWYKQAIGDFTLKIGRIDANIDAAKPGANAYDGFSIIEHGLDFLQSAAAYSPPIVPMATYPNPSPGVELFYHQSGFYAGAGAFYANSSDTFLNFSGHPETVQIPHGGMFFIGEAGSRWTMNLAGLGENLPGHAAVGGWYHNGTFPLLSGTGTQTGAGGGYLFVDQSLMNFTGQDDLGFFFVGGLSNKENLPMDQNLAFGLTARPLARYRPKDLMGVMTSWVHLPAQPGLQHPFEMASEIFYKVQITDWASIKPSFAYIANPSGKHPDAAVLTVRAEVDF
jgi:porin